LPTDPRDHDRLVGHFKLRFGSVLGVGARKGEDGPLVRFLRRHGVNVSGIQHACARADEPEFSVAASDCEWVMCPLNLGENHKVTGVVQAADQMLKILNRSCKKWAFMFGDLLSVKDYLAAIDRRPSQFELSAEYKFGKRLLPEFGALHTFFQVLQGLCKLLDQAGFKEFRKHFKDLDKPKIAKTDFYKAEMWVTELVYGVVLGSMALHGVLREGDAEIDLDIEEWVRERCVHSKHAGNKYWSGVLQLLTGLQMFRDGVRRQNADLINSGKRYALLTHFATGDALHQRVTAQSLLNTLHVWPEGVRQLHRWAPSVVSSRGGRFRHSESKDEKNDFECMHETGGGCDWVTETAVQTVSKANIRRRTGGGTLQATKLACDVAKLQSVIRSRFRRTMEMCGEERRNKAHVRKVDTAKMLHVANAIVESKRDPFSDIKFADGAGKVLPDSNPKVTGVSSRFLDMAYGLAQKKLRKSKRDNYRRWATTSMSKDIWPGAGKPPKDY